MEFALNSNYLEQATTLGYVQIHLVPHNMWYVLINHGGNHWLFVVINPSLKRVLQYNLLPTVTLRDYTQDISQKLTQFLGHVWPGEHVSTPRQQNKYHCGVYTLTKIHRLVNNSGNTQGTLSQQSLMDYLLSATPMSTLYATARGQTPTPEIRSHTNSTPQARPTLAACIKSPKTQHLTQQALTRFRSRLLKYNQTKPSSPTPGQNQHIKWLPTFRKTQLFPPEEPRVHSQLMSKYNPRPVTKLYRVENNWTYGDRITTKNLNIIQLYSHNINGLPVNDIAAAVTENQESMKDRGVDLMEWSKTNVEWNSYPLHLATHHVFKQVFPQGKRIPTTSEIPAATDLKTGGNLMGLHNTINHRTNVTKTDYMGRWTWATMEGKQGA